MFTKISVLIPTRCRLGRLSTLLDSYERSTQSLDDSELVFRVDDDDRDTQHLLRGYNVVVGPRCGGYRSMPQFYNEMAVQASGDVLMCGNDDMVFKTFRWPEALLEVANRYPDGVFDLGISTHNEAHYPFSTVSRRLVEHLGFIWDPRIFWGDIFLRDVCAWFGRCVMVPGVRIEHDWAGYAPDQVFNETRPAKAEIEGSATYWANVHAPAVQEAVRKLESVFQQVEV